MSFNNWEVYTSSFDGTGSAMVVSISLGKANSQGYTPPTGIPMTGTGSLQLQAVSGGGGEKANIRPASSQAWRGLVKGETLTLIESVADPQKSSGVYAFGLFCMANQADLTSGSGHCYTMAFQSSGQCIQILKCASGVTLSGVTASGVSVLASSTSGQWTSNTVYAAGLRWRVSGTTIDITAKFGPQANLFALSALLSATDSVSAFVSSVGEGMWIHSVTNPFAEVYFDSSRFATIP